MKTQISEHVWNHLLGLFNYLCQRKHFMASPHAWLCWDTTGFFQGDE